MIFISRFPYMTYIIDVYRRDNTGSISIDVVSHYTMAL